MIIREDRIVAAGALLPLAETSIHTERFGTRHRAALGITEQTDAVVVVVSEENGQISLVERARIVRNLTEAGLARAIQGFLDPAGGRRGAFGWRSATGQPGGGHRRRRLQTMRRFVGRSEPFRARRRSRRPPAAAGAAAAAPPPAPPAALEPPRQRHRSRPSPRRAHVARPVPPPMADDEPSAPSGARSPR